MLVCVCFALLRLCVFVQWLCEVSSEDKPAEAFVTCHSQRRAHKHANGASKTIHSAVAKQVLEGRRKTLGRFRREGRARGGGGNSSLALNFYRKLFNQVSQSTISGPDYTECVAVWCGSVSRRKDAATKRVSGVFASRLK